MDSLGYHHLMWDDAAHFLPSTPGVAALVPSTPGALFCPCDSGGGGRSSSCCSCLRNGSNASSFLSDAAAHGPPAPSAETRVGEIWGARGSAALVEEKKLDRDETCSAAIALDRHPKEKVCKKSRKRSEQKDEKRSKPKLELLPPPDGVVHVRARRGQATDSHSLAERVRRERLSERMKILQGLVPGCDKIKGKQRVLEEIINYVQSLQHQIEFLSMKLASVSPLLHDFGINLDHLSMNNQPDNQNMITDDKEMMMPQPLPSLYDVSAFLQSSSSIDHRIRNYTEQTMEVEEDSEALLSSVPGQGQCPFSQGAGGSSVMQQFIMLDQKLGFPLNHLTVQQQELFGLANN